MMQVDPRAGRTASNPCARAGGPFVLDQTMTSLSDALSGAIQRREAA